MDGNFFTLLPDKKTPINGMMKYWLVCGNCRGRTKSLPRQSALLCKERRFSVADASEICVHSCQGLPFATCLVVSPRMRTFQCHSQGAVQRVNPVNVVLVEPSCEDFGSSVETFGTDIAGAVVAVGEESNLMYVSETDVTEACRSATHSRVL